MQMTPLPSTERLRELFDYDPETGRLYWRYRASAPRHWNTKYVGKRAGSAKGRYRAVRVDGADHQEHRIIWKFVHGEDPEPEIDHENGDGRDNRLANLRSATRPQNRFNSRPRADRNSVSKCVYFRQDRGVYRAYIGVNGKKVHLGHFPTEGEAHAAYRAAAPRLHGEFARTE